MKVLLKGTFPGTGSLLSEICWIFMVDTGSCLFLSWRGLVSRTGLWRWKVASPFLELGIVEIFVPHCPVSFGNGHLVNCQGSPGHNPIGTRPLGRQRVWVGEESPTEDIMSWLYCTSFKTQPSFLLATCWASLSLHATSW